MTYCRSERRYHKPLNDGQLDLYTVKKFSEETNKKIMWVKRMYVNWRTYRNKISTGEMIFMDLDDIKTIDEANLLFAVPRFITKIRKVDGSDFPAKTLYDIVICLQFFLETQGFNYKLLNNDGLSKIRFTLDNLMKKRTEDGVGNSVRRAHVLSFTDEDLLWSLGFLGTHDPFVLMNTVVFLLGMTCALRAGQEHRKLRSIPFRSQFEFLYDDQARMCLRYTEDLGHKTNKGGINHRKLEPKVVDVYPLDSIDRCPVRIIHYYMSKLPSNRTCSAMYLQPRKKFTSTSWYLNRPVGVNTLRNVVKDVCKMGGIPGYFTNHSLRASSATHMYVNDVEEQVIQEITGHRSLAVRSYKRTCDAQKKNASRCIFQKK